MRHFALKSRRNSSLRRAERGCGENAGKKIIRAAQPASRHGQCFCLSLLFCHTSRRPPRLGGESSGLSGENREFGAADGQVAVLLDEPAVFPGDLTRLAAKRVK